MTALITDIDGTLLGHEQGLKELNAYIMSRRNDFYLVYATGRCLEEYMEAMSGGMLIKPDAAIINTGADILVEKKGFSEDLSGWHEFIEDKTWDAGRVIEAISGLKGITAQAHLSRNKVCYFTDPLEAGSAAGRVKQALENFGIKAKVIISHGKYIDVLPEKCDKAKAALFLLKSVGFDPVDAIVAGDSENDLDLFLEFKRGIVVLNALENLKCQLKDRDIFFASCNCASGILEGLKYYLD